MKAIRYHGPKDCRYEEVPAPAPGPDDVLVRVRAAGICATDLEVHDGTMFYFTSGMTRVPIIPGHEWAGEVVEVGKNVREFQPGDRVTGECSVGCRQCECCKKGWYMVQTARVYGARLVILVGSRPERLTIGRQLGADHALAYRQADVPSQIRDLTNGHGVDVVLEAVGKPSVWPIIAGILAPRARVMMTGLFAGATCPVLFDPLQDRVTSYLRLQPSHPVVCQIA